MIKDMKTGITTIEVVDDFGSVQHPDDPLSSARTHCQLKQQR